MVYFMLYVFYQNKNGKSKKKGSMNNYKHVWKKWKSFDKEIEDMKKNQMEILEMKNKAK